MPSPQIQPFFSWFQANHGFIDTDSMDVVQFPDAEGGRGAVALKDIPEGHTVFSIPRSLVLSTRTSSLPSKFGIDAWKSLGLHEGWSGLMLCMMWEAALGAQSKWSAYFDVLPSAFDTPMFWNDEDLAELQGTCVVEKLGRDEALKDYNEKVLPTITSRPDLFSPADIATRYSLSTYHLMGSRILSRSFTIEKTEDDEQNADEDAGNTSIVSTRSAMDVDEPKANNADKGDCSGCGHDHGHDHAHGGHAGHGEDGEDSDDDDEANAEVVMIPLADILNARYQSENVRLFYEPDCLKMVSIKPIKAGEQIWNTYGDLPNAELLRSYGHVDWLPLPAPFEGEFGNPGDVAELRADVLVQALATDGVDAAKIAQMEERIDWWLEEGGDDVFLLDMDTEGDDSDSDDEDADKAKAAAASEKASAPELEIPLEILAFTRLLVSDADWARAKGKGKPPKPIADAQTLRVVHAALVRRLAAYPTTLEEDRRVVADPAQLGAMGVNRRHALVVRLGEKRVVDAFRVRAEELLEKALEEEKDSAAAASKRKGGPGENVKAGGAGKKSRK